MRSPPLVPEDFRRNGRPRAGAYLERACFSEARRMARPSEFRSADAFAKERWGTDSEPVSLLLRGAVPPATTATLDWAGVLAQDAVGDFIGSLVPSAGARLLEAAPRVSLSGVDTLLFPRRMGAISATAVAWVAEGEPAPVLQYVLESVGLGPARKLVGIVVATRELLASSSGETIFRQLLRENVAMSLDASLFSNVAATAARPAGILAGVAPLAAAPNGDDAALTTDLSRVAAAIAPVTSGLVYVAHPAQANAIKIRRGTTFADVPVWPTLGVAPGTVIALDPAAFVSAFGPEPEISASTEALLHMETNPQPIGAPIASPSRSLYQTDAVALKVKLQAAWAWRAAGVAWISGTTW